MKGGEKEEGGTCHNDKSGLWRSGGEVLGD